MRWHNNNNNDYIENIDAFKENINDALQTHNLPTSRSDVAAVSEGDEPPFQVDLKLYPKKKKSTSGQKPK